MRRKRVGFWRFKLNASLTRQKIGKHSFISHFPSQPGTGAERNRKHEIGKTLATTIGLVLFRMNFPTVLVTGQEATHGQKKATT